LIVIDSDAEFNDVMNLATQLRKVTAIPILVLTSLNQE